MIFFGRPAMRAPAQPVSRFCRNRLKAVGLLMTILPIGSTSVDRMAGRKIEATRGPGRKSGRNALILRAGRAFRGSNRLEST
jgi:hypothetical protein